MKHSKDVYENFDPCDGDMDIDVRCQTRKVVKTRSPHVCNFNAEPHAIEVGSMALIDEAIYEGKWQSQYFCTDCIDKWLAEIGEEYG